MMPSANIAGAYALGFAVGHQLRKTASPNGRRIIEEVQSLEIL